MGLFDRFKSGTTPTQQGLTAKEWYDKGTALIKSGRHQEALQCCDKALEIDPQNVRAWNNKGLTFGTLGRLQEAFPRYGNALKIDPQYAT